MPSVRLQLSSNSVVPFTMEVPLPQRLGAFVPAPGEDDGHRDDSEPGLARRRKRVKWRTRREYLLYLNGR